METTHRSEELEALKRCYKCEHQLLDNLNMIYNSSTSVIVTWNRFQIFVYEDLNMEKTAKVFVPEFQVRQIIVSNNYLVCLDTSGNVHTTCMKFKNPAQKRFKSSFQPRDQAVLVCALTEDNVLSLKYESDVYYLCYNKINPEFSQEKRVSLLYNDRWPLPKPTEGESLIFAHKLIENEIQYISPIFSMNRNIKYNDMLLVIISIDKHTVYGCLFSPRMPEEDIKLLKLYTCPTEICNFEIVVLDELYVLIGIKIGTLVQLCLRDVSKKPQLVHLNTALHKFKTIKDTVIYTDGKCMWKTDRTFKDNITFSQFFVRHVKDFVKFGDQIACTTFSNLLYVFPIDDEVSYIKPETTDEYCTAEKILNNSECLHRIFKELEKNSELTKRINEEGNFITALSLSKRQDIMDNIIQHSITVYEFYEDAKADNTNIILTEKIAQYFDPNSFYILIKLSTKSLQHMFNNILTKIFDDAKIHVSLSTEQRLLKTISVKITDTLKKIEILIPISINDNNISEITVNMELMSSLPGALDENQKLWVTLYRKQVTLSSENFIKSMTINTNLEVKESIKDLVLNEAITNFGGAYKFIVTENYYISPEFALYLNLPLNFKVLFKNENIAINYLNKRKATQIIQCFTSEDFIRSNSDITFEVGTQKVKLKILNDEFTSPQLRVSCSNMTVAFHIRNMISKIMYEDFGHYKPGQEFVKYLLYSAAENVQKQIKSCVTNQADLEEFQLHAENFERNIIGALPL